ncbi:nitrite extrusion protein 1 NarK [Nitzschia inconspicua]|uniref:Nitrate/nitrite transporter n=1 Tax=Nitzschia inconspicua TaxID=303405 RepID=A0A9K3LEW2_9STRA|nr:nitrite extrusion protein 1 NarK [Nitzschia inconspicua]
MRSSEQQVERARDVPTGQAPLWKKYKSYDVAVDRHQDDMATEIKLCSFARPHMRVFHCTWWSFFVAFFVWFAITPLLPEIQDDLNLTKQEIWSSSIAGVGSTIAVRFLLGPLCDKYGARLLYLIILCSSSVPAALTGLVNSAEGLIILRFFIGIAGGSFVMCQYWSSVTFAKEIVGTANAIVAGWGNLGAGMTNLIVGSILFPMFRSIFDGDTEKAWRTVCVVPAFVAFTTGIIVYFISDDCPKGNYSELKRNGAMKEVSASMSFVKGCANYNTWLLFIQYAICFGVELTMNNAAAEYFRGEFDLTNESAGAIASLFGWMNLFARGIGGHISDMANAKWGMPGRLWAQTILLAFEGAFVLVFANTKSLAGAILVMVLFSVFVQAAEGTSFGIVPYVDPPNTGSISGIVGAGGNVGAVGFGMAFRQLDRNKDALTIMGATVLVFSILSLFMVIEGHDSVFFRNCGKKAEEEDEEMLQVETSS